jgi:hypothetical protein
MLPSLILNALLAQASPAPVQAPERPPAVIKYVDLIGKWKGKDDKGIEGEFEFMKDQRAIIRIKDRQFGVSDYPVKYLKFGYDFSQTPALLTIYYIRRPIDLLGEITFIIKILSENQIIIGRRVIENRHPKNFDALPSNFTILLTREH